MMTSIQERFEALGEQYSKAHGAFIPLWNTDVDLSPAEFDQKEKQAEDRYVKDYYDSLQYTLLETGHPETIDRTLTPRNTHNAEHVTAAILASPCEIVGLLLEGGKQAPDTFHLILSTTWLSKQDEIGQYCSSRLWVTKAITFHKNGQSYIDVFKPPRKVTYFLDFFTGNITGGQRNDGEKFENDLECPMSSSVKLSELIDNKVWTRCIMADVGMAFPITLAFLFQPTYSIQNKHSNITLVCLEAKEDREIYKRVQEFLNSNSMNEVTKVVVKPSGPQCYGSIGVSYHDRTDENAIVDAVTELLQDIQPGSAVLLEEFIEGLTPLITSGCEKRKPWGADSNLSFRLRVTVCRDFNGKPVTVQISCGMQSRSRPINGDNTVPQSLDSTLLAYNVFDKERRDRAEKILREQSEAVMSEIMEQEKCLTVDQRGCLRAQTEVIGIDLVLCLRKDELIPVGIEVNSHDCTINCQIREFVQDLCDTNIPWQNGTSSSLGQCYLPWIRNIMVRSQLYLMEDKVVVIVGAGAYSKRFIWPDCQSYGIKVVLIDSNSDCAARNHVYHFIHYDFSDHLLDEDHAMNISTMLSNRKFKIDGCLTFWEDCGPLAALLREQLELSKSGVSYESAMSAKRKSRTFEILRSRKDDTPHWPRSYLYSSASHRIRDKETLITATKEIEFPAIVKLEHGSSAVGVKLVQSKEDLMQEYELITTTLTQETDFPGIGLGFDNTLLVMDYHTGSEHDVDVVIFNRHLVAAFISDNGPTREPVYTETCAVMPSTIPKDKQAQLVAAAYQCCVELDLLSDESKSGPFTTRFRVLTNRGRKQFEYILAKGEDAGLTNGTFNVELKMTAVGPKLLEINARMGGFYLRDWVKRLYDVDLMLASIMIACGIKPFLPKCDSRTHIMGTMLMPSLHSHVLDDDVYKMKLTSLIESREVIWNQFSETAVSDSELFEEPFANLAVQAPTGTEARNKLVAVCKDLGIDKEIYDVEYFTEEF